MIYATREAAAAVRNILNAQRGYAPAYIYRLANNTFTVIRTYNCKRFFTDTYSHYTLDD